MPRDGDTRLVLHWVSETADTAAGETYDAETETGYWEHLEETERVWRDTSRNRDRAVSHVAARDAHGAGSVSAEVYDGRSIEWRTVEVCHVDEGDWGPVE